MAAVGVIIGEGTDTEAAGGGVGLAVWSSTGSLIRSLTTVVSMCAVKTQPPKQEIESSGEQSEYSQDLYPNGDATQCVHPRK